MYVDDSLHLHGHHALSDRIERAPHLAHAAAAQQLDQAITPRTACPPPAHHNAASRSKRDTQHADVKMLTAAEQN